MAWFHLRPKKAKNFAERVASNNEKYGNYDYANDSRVLDATFEKTFVAMLGDISVAKVIVVGSNSGYELNVLRSRFPAVSLVATDISNKALEKISESLPAVLTTHADMERLPFEDKQFDAYVNCRAIQSSNVDMEKAIREAVRVTRGRILISVPNGYLVEGKIVNGLYNYDNEQIDEQEPYRIVESLKKSLEKRGYSVDTKASKAEIFLVANRD